MASSESANVLVLIDLNCVNVTDDSCLSLDGVQLIIGKYMCALYREQAQRSGGKSRLGLSWGVRLFTSANQGLTPRELDGLLGRDFQHAASFQRFSKDSFSGLQQELESVLNACTEKLAKVEQGKEKEKVGTGARETSVELLESVMAQVSNDYDWRERQLSTNGCLDSVHSSHLLLLSKLPPSCLDAHKDAIPFEGLERKANAQLRIVDCVSQLREKVSRRGCSAPRLVWVEGDGSGSSRAASVDQLRCGLRAHASECISYASVLAMESYVDDLWGLKRNHRSVMRKIVTSPILGKVTSPIMFQSPSLKHFSNTPPTPYLRLSASTPSKKEKPGEELKGSTWSASLKLECVEGTQSLTVSISPLATAVNSFKDGSTNNTGVLGGGTGRSDGNSNVPPGQKYAGDGTDKERNSLSVRGIMQLSAFPFSLVDSEKFLVHSNGASSEVLTRLLRHLLSTRSMAIVDSRNVFGPTTSRSAVLIALTPNVAQLASFGDKRCYASSVSAVRCVIPTCSEVEFYRVLDAHVADSNLERLLEGGVFAPSRSKKDNSRAKMLYEKYENILQAFLNKGETKAPEVTTPVAVPDHTQQCLTKEDVLNRFKHQASLPLRDLSNIAAVKRIQGDLDMFRKGLNTVESMSDRQWYHCLRECANAELLQPVRDIFSRSMPREDKRDQYKRQVLLRLCMEALRVPIKDPIAGKSKLKAELAHLSFSMFGKEDPTQFRRFVDDSLFKSFGTALPKTVHWIYDQFFSCEPSIEKKSVATPMKALHSSSKADNLTNYSTNQKRRRGLDSEQRRKRRKTTSVTTDLVGFGALNVDESLRHGKSRKSLKKSRSSDDKPREPKGVDFQVEAVLTAKRGKGSLQAKRKLTLNHFTSGMSNMKALFKEVSYPQTASKPKTSRSENRPHNRNLSHGTTSTTRQHAQANVKSRGRRFNKHRKNYIVSETPARSHAVPSYSANIVQPTPGTHRSGHSRDLFRSLPETPKVQGSQYSKRAHALRRSATVVAETPMQAPERPVLRRSTSLLLWSSDDEA